MRVGGLLGAASYLEKKLFLKFDEVSEHKPSQYFALLTEAAAIYEAAGQTVKLPRSKQRQESFRKAILI